MKTDETVPQERSRKVNETPQFECKTQIGPLSESRWKLGGARGQEASYSAIVTPPDRDEDDEKLVSPLHMLRPISPQNIGVSSPRTLSPFNWTKQRFSTIVSGAATAAKVSQRVTHVMSRFLVSRTKDKPQIARQGRALCLQYIKTQIRRSTLCTRKQIVMKRLQAKVDTEYGEEAVSNKDSGVLAGLRALCTALEKKKPNAFRQVARQASRTPKSVLRSESALTNLSLALIRAITRGDITWSKIAAVYCVCGALAREAAEAALGEPALELVCAPANAIEVVLYEDLGSWIASNGRWDGLIKRLRASERDQRAEKHLQVIMAFFVLACFTLLLFRWVLHGRPAYNDSTSSLPITIYNTSMN